MRPKVTKVMCPPEDVSPNFQIMLYPDQDRTGFAILNPDARLYRFPDALWRECSERNKEHLRELIPHELAFHNLVGSWFRNEDMGAWDLVAPRAPAGYFVSADPYPAGWMGLPL